MASPCIVMYCKNIGSHRLPKDETRRAEWIQAIQYIKPELTIRRNSFVCPAHFRPADFVRPDRAPRILKKHAVPSVFPWTPVHVSRPPRPKSWTIDKSKVQKTYSRAPPISYVEMPLGIQQDIESAEDPLQELEDKKEVWIKIEDQLPPLNMDNTEVVTKIKLEETQTEEDRYVNYVTVDINPS